MDYTKGEWEIEKKEHGFLGVTTTETGICSQIATEANAHLIAAAPDMYEALRELAKAYDVELPLTDCDHPRYWVKAIQALAKAEGK